MNLSKYLRRRTRGLRLFLLILMFVIGYFLIIIQGTWIGNEGEQEEKHVHLSRHLLDANKTSSDGVYPFDVISLENLKKGAILLHVIGMIYMFVALAIVCDEFFVPSLGVFMETLDLSEDVAGATFMAAGGSAPELFISLFGTFLAKSNVGIGTIVGSAVFNILFVIGMCALFSKQILSLTWWPLFRDVTFYSIDLILLIIFFQDEVIYWWEALILFICYICYVVFMKFNTSVEQWIKKKLPFQSVNKVKSTDTVKLEKPRRTSSLPILHSGSKFRQGMFQLMIHTIDPLGAEEDKVHATCDLKNMDNSSMPSPAHSPHNLSKPDEENNMKVQAISNGGVATPVNGSATTVKQYHNQKTVITSIGSTDAQNEIVANNGTVNTAEYTGEIQTQEPTLEEDENEPLDLSWPPTTRKRFTYMFIAPIIFPLWITLPDVRREDRRKYFVVTFIGSILWIAMYSYLMLWWANQTGVTIGIPDEVMGLTILAAGTSIPDLITSVIVAKKGLGDMAVSSSVGSNIFDITVGLPIPWLIYSAIYRVPIIVDSNGLFCSIVLLFMMLLAVIITIAVAKWKMNHLLGIVMLIFYCIFVVLSVLLELNIIICPVTV